MKLKLTRRQFGKLAIATTTTAAIAYLGNKTLAQTPEVSILGALAAARSSTPGGVLLRSLNVVLNQVETLPTPEIQNGLQTGEKLTGFTSLPDGTLILAISPVRASKKEENPTRLVFVGTSPKSLNVSGLKKGERLESLLAANDGSLLALRIKKNGRPPSDLVSVDPSTGAISLVDKIKLPQTERFTQLAQSPNGTLYTIAVGRQGQTSLVQLDLGKGKPITLAQLKIDGTVWNSGLNDLVSSPASPADQLFALGAPRYQRPYNLYTVDVNTGAMTLVREFDVTKITAPLV